MKVKMSTIFTIRKVRAKDHITSKKQLYRWVYKQTDKKWKYRTDDNDDRGGRLDKQRI